MSPDKFFTEIPRFNPEEEWEKLCQKPFQTKLDAQVSLSEFLMNANAAGCRGAFKGKVEEDDEKYYIVDI